MLWRTRTVAGKLVRPLSNIFSKNVIVQRAASVSQVNKRSYTQYQQSLPRLPVQPLSGSLTKFLQTVRPLLSDEEFKHAQELVTDFQKPESTAHKLQALLEERAAKMDNWLADWWQNVAYLDYRMPVTIHVSPGITMPTQNFRGIEGQIRTAAKMIGGLLDFKDMLDSYSLPVDTLGGKPLCMYQYYWMLSTCRIPGAKRDMMVNFPADHPKAPKHITVIRNNHFFTVPVYGSNGSPLSIEQLTEQLKRIVDQSETVAPPVGILGSDNRDTWYKAYSKMCKDKKNKQNFEQIQNSIVVVCLDKSMNSNDADEMTSNLYQMNNGSGSKYNSGNRYPDKTLQVIVGHDGQLGAVYEHATAEGPPVLAILEHSLSFLKKDVSKETSAVGVAPPTRLDFSVSADVSDMIASSCQALDVTIRDLDMVALKFDGYGKNLPKAHKLSPDAFIQVAFQLAYYKLYGHPAATYESGSLRRFYRGRTDTIRSCTSAALEYCQTMTDPNSSAAERAQKLRDAVDAHRKYTNEVVNGEGIDRHFLGLKLTAIENGMDLPKLFQDPIFETSCYWQLSTSQVASKSGGLLCFAPVVPDGYGICYNPMEEHLLFAISAWNSCPETGATKFRDSLRDALNDANDVLRQSANL